MPPDLKGSGATAWWMRIRASVLHSNFNTSIGRWRLGLGRRTVHERREAPFHAAVSNRPVNILGLNYTFTAKPGSQRRHGARANTSFIGLASAELLSTTQSVRRPPRTNRFLRRETFSTQIDAANELWTVGMCMRFQVIPSRRLRVDLTRIDMTRASRVAIPGHEATSLSVSWFGF
jgi:hypothetical protein